jgi:hypothetical protein
MKNINTEVEKTLQSWDNIERFEANPFLYTRLEQEIKNLEIPPKVNRIWFWQPLLMAVILVLNFFTIVTALNSETNESQTVYDAIAEQYNLSTDSETNFELY